MQTTTLPPELGRASGAAFAATIAGGPTAPPAPSAPSVPAASAVVTGRCRRRAIHGGRCPPPRRRSRRVPTPRLAALDPTGGAAPRFAALDAAATLDAPVIGEVSLLALRADDELPARSRDARGGMAGSSRPRTCGSVSPVALKELIDPVAEQRGGSMRDGACHGLRLPCTRGSCRVRGRPLAVGRSVLRDEAGCAGRPARFA